MTPPSEAGRDSGERGSLSVAHVLATAQHRGAERFAVELARTMSSQGVSGPRVALVAGGGPPLLDVEVLGRHRLAPSTLWRLRRRARPAGVVVAHGSSSLAACALGLAGSRPFVYRSIGDPRYWLSTRGRRARTIGFLRRSALVVVMWPEAVDVMRDVVGERPRVELIRKGIDVTEPLRDGRERDQARARLGIDRDRVVVYLGALSPEKDPLLAIHAVEHLPGAHLLMAGGGPLLDDVRAEAARRLPGRHTILGPVQSTRPVLAAADVLVLPSRTEGVPNAPLEAALLGIPSVVTDVGGARSTVDDGAGGRVVAARDPDAIAAALDSVLATSDVMGAAARRFVETHFSLERSAAAWIDACRQIRGRSARSYT